MTDVFLACGQTWLTEAATLSVRDAVLAAEPTPQAQVDEAHLDGVLGVFADFVDHKSPFTLALLSLCPPVCTRRDDVQRAIKGRLDGH